MDTDDSDFTFNQLLSQIRNTESCDLSDVILTDSERNPDWGVWDTLEKVDKPEALENIPFNTYFDICPSSPVNSPLSIILERLLPEEDTTTSIKQSAFRYLKDTANDLTYLCIILMTNKGVRRNKKLLESIRSFRT